MQVENHKEEVPFAHYCEKFKALRPEEAATRLGIPFENNEFAVTLLGVRYYIHHPDAEIRADADGIALHSLPARTFLLRLLLEGRCAAPTEDFKTFRELPWGEVYVTPFTGRVLTRAAFTFGTRIAAFRAAAEKMGATPVNHADAGYEFRFFDEYRLRLLLWEGDDEFPPNAQLLYTANFADGFAAEDRVVAGDLLLNSLKRLL